VEADAALIRPEGAIELDSKATVYLEIAPIVLPGHAEDDLSFWLNKTLQDFGLDIFRMLIEDRSQTLKYFFYRLVKLGFTGITLENLIINGLYDGIG
jgi:hypothetical protein